MLISIRGKIGLLGLSAIVTLFSCTKIDTTRLGGDLIPAVDNVNTFETILPVVSNNYIPADSTRIVASEEHAAGFISSDPLFGTTRATTFFEMKPTPVDKYQFAPTDSIVKFDSAVLVLKYSTYYGDSLSPLTLRLYEVDRKMQYDTINQPIYTLNPDLGVNRNRFWGEKTMAANQFKDTVYIKRGDSIYARVTDQLRIRLNQSLAEALFNQAKDTVNGAFVSDSAYKEYLPGFALEATGNAQSLFYFKLKDVESQMVFYFQTRLGKIDTTSRSYGVSSLCGHATKIEQNRAGAEINNYLTANPNTGASQVYLQATPGTMASLKVKGIDTLTNRVIHRAELRVTQLPITGLGIDALTPPQVLYLDASYRPNPSSDIAYRGLPYDLFPFAGYYCYPGQGIDFAYFGGPYSFEAVNGERVAVVRFNISRYLQGILTRQEPTYDLRLSAPFSMYYSECVNTFSLAYPPQVFPLQFRGTSVIKIANGRVRVAGGNHSNPDYRMQLRVIYSRL